MPLNGRMICSQLDGGLGMNRITEMCQITCNENYIVSGPALRTCSETGIWSDESDAKCVGKNIK